MRRFARTIIVTLTVIIITFGFISVLTPAPLIEPGALRPCPGTPNCVSSLSPIEKERVVPLAQPGADIPWPRLRSAVIEAGGTIVLERDGYLWATFTSLVFRFVDDLEIRRDANGTLQVRSASRAGTYDFGVNRRRVEALRKRLQTAPD